MGSPIANMLLGQAAPSSLSGLSPEAQAALRALNGETGVPAPAPAMETMPAPTSPTPTPAPPPAQGGGIADMLIGWLSNILPKAKDIAPPPAQATPAPLTPEELAKRNQRIAQ